MTRTYLLEWAIALLLIAPPQIHAAETASSCAARNQVAGNCKPYTFDEVSKTCVSSKCPTPQQPSPSPTNPGSSGVLPGGTSGKPMDPTQITSGERFLGIGHVADDGTIQFTIPAKAKALRERGK